MIKPFAYSLAALLAGTPTVVFSANTSLQWGIDRTTSPSWTICAYDGTNTCIPFLSLPPSGGGGKLLLSAVPNGVANCSTPLQYMSTAQVASVQAGDLSADVTAPIQTWLASMTTGRCYYLPPGFYSFKSPLAQPTGLNHVAVTGAGRYLSQLVYTGTASSSDMFTAGNATVGISNTNSVGMIFGGFMVRSTVAMLAGSNAWHFLNMEETSIYDIEPGGDTSYSQLAYDGIYIDGFHHVSLSGFEGATQHDCLKIRANNRNSNADIWVNGNAWCNNSLTGVHIGGGAGGVYLDNFQALGNDIQNYLVDDALEQQSGQCTSCSISGTVLTVGGTVTGLFWTGEYIVGSGVPPGMRISSFGTGTGGAGTYNLSQSATVSAESMYSSDAYGNREIEMNGPNTVIDGVLTSQFCVVLNGPHDLSASLTMSAYVGSSTGACIVIDNLPNGTVTMGLGRIYNATGDAIVIDDSTANLVVSSAMNIGPVSGFAVNCLVPTNDNVTGHGVIKFDGMVNVNAGGYFSTNCHIPWVQSSNTAVSSASVTTQNVSLKSNYYTCDATTAPIVFELPLATGSGARYTFSKTDAGSNNCDLTPNVADQLNGASVYHVSSQYQTVTIVDMSANNWATVQ